MAALSRTLLVVCPEGPVLRVFTCVARLQGWLLGRTETLDLPSAELQPEAIAAALRPLALRWSDDSALKDGRVEPLRALVAPKIPARPWIIPAVGKSGAGTRS